MDNVKISRGSRITPEMRLLETVLRKWQNLMSDSTWIESGDVPWWYNERASLSVFAGAVWKSQGWAFEEYSAPKAVIEQNRRRVYSGRCDIQFSVNEFDFIAEAKQCWPNIGADMDRGVELVRHALRKAVYDARQNSELPKGSRRIGMVFAVPKVHESRQENIEQLLNKFLLRLYSLNRTTLSWVFPKTSWNLRPDNEPFKRVIFPGVVLLIRA